MPHQQGQCETRGGHLCEALRLAASGQGPSALTVLAAMFQTQLAINDSY